MAEVIQLGRQERIERERRIIENLLQMRFGTLDNELQAIIELLLALSPEDFRTLVLQLSNLSPEKLLTLSSQQCIIRHFTTESAPKNQYEGLVRH
ncbi:MULTISPECIES: hypothetical protein [Nostocales]|uniref:DUF4351 domain-containing protein n=2 Tax=Nostocales TaxID=1161 RepID=A0ABW8WGL1_9CYAN|nr:hypothetical protein [Tolypothrix bouteillei]